MTHRRARIAALTLSLAAGIGALAGCGGHNEPPSDLCKNIASLSSAVDTINNTPVSATTLPTLTTTLNQLGSAVDTLSAHATEELKPEIDAVESTAAALRSSIATATKSDTVANRGQVENDRAAFTSAVKNLDDQSSSTC